MAKIQTTGNIKFWWGCRATGSFIHCCGHVKWYRHFFKNFYLFVYLFLAVLGLRFCARAFSSCGKWGTLFIAVRGPLTIAASLVAEHRLQTRSSCGSRAQLLRGMWDPPRPGLEPMSPVLAGRFSTTAPPGKPFTMVLIWISLMINDDHLYMFLLASVYLLWTNVYLFRSF